MKLETRHNCVFLMILLALPFIITGCHQSDSGEINPPTLLKITQKDLGGLSADEATTLRSLEKQDDYPFYVMQYSGSYDYPKISYGLAGDTDFACSLFASLGGTGDMFYGRNFDWSVSPALLLFTHPPDGYASISIVDLEFIGIRSENSQDLDELPLKERIALLTAPSMPFDGMNEYGLVIGMAAVPGDYQSHAAYDPSKPTMGSIGIIRLALDHARNVDEAVKLFKHYNIDFRGGPLIHYLLADRSGKAMLIEFYQGEMILMPNENPWHIVTNHFRCIAKGDGGCLRYRLLSEHLASKNGQLDASSAMGLLEEVSQEMTQWSVVYNITSGEVVVAIGQDYENTYTFQLEMALP